MRIFQILLVIITLIEIFFSFVVFGTGHDGEIFGPIFLTAALAHSGYLIMTRKWKKFHFSDSVIDELIKENRIIEAKIANKEGLKKLKELENEDM